MKYVTVNNIDIPALGLGTYRLKGKQAIQLITQGIEAGFRHIDTAQMYDNEAEVGKAIKQSGQPADAIFLTTKVWPTNLSKSRFLPSVEESLQKLQRDVIDLLLIHWPTTKSAQVEEAVIELMKAQEKGLTRFIGVSNFNIQLLQQTLDLGADIILNQVEYHPFINQTKLYNWMQEHKLLLTAYAPIAHGEVLKNQTLKTIAERHGKNAVQITLRWMMQQENVLAIPMTSKPERLPENLDLFDFELTADEMEAIGQLKRVNRRLVESAFSPQWD